METVRDSNAFANSDELEKELRVAELEAGYRLLNSRRVNPNTVKVILGGALIYLATKFSDQMIGTLAKVAWEALKKAS